MKKRVIVWMGLRMDRWRGVGLHFGVWRANEALAGVKPVDCSAE